METEKTHCIYAITNTKTLQRYIGRTNSLQKRKWEHFSPLKNKKHINPHLQNAYNKYGRKAFEMEALCSGLDYEEVVELEQLILDECFDDLYNCSRSATTPIGPGDKHTEETKKKISEAQKGRTFTEGHRQKISEAKKGTKHTEESKQKVSENRKGKCKGADNPMYAPFIITFPDGTVHRWETKKEACVAYRISRQTIGRYLKGTRTPGNSPSSRHLKDTIWQYI